MLSLPQRSQVMRRTTTGTPASAAAGPWQARAVARCRSCASAVPAATATAYLTPEHRPAAVADEYMPPGLRLSGGPADTAANRANMRAIGVIRALGFDIGAGRRLRGQPRSRGHIGTLSLLLGQLRAEDHCDFCHGWLLLKASGAVWRLADPVDNYGWSLAADGGCDASTSAFAASMASACMKKPSEDHTPWSNRQCHAPSRTRSMSMRTALVGRARDWLRRPLGATHGRSFAISIWRFISRNIAWAVSARRLARCAQSGEHHR
jgi:hypothetical protein